jgi:hypothetical protein
MKILALSLFALTSVAANADDFYTTCRTLGQVGQCSAVPFCAERSSGRCVPKLDKNSPEWIRDCAIAGPDPQWCGYQAYCVWEESTQCLPRQ